MRFCEIVISHGQLRFPAGCGILMNYMFLGHPVDHLLGMFHRRKFLFGVAGSEEPLNSCSHFRFICPVAPGTLGCLPNLFFSV